MSKDNKTILECDIKLYYKIIFKTLLFQLGWVVYKILIFCKYG